MLIIGPTGTGKSVHGNTLVALEQKYGGFTYIFDIGGSYESVVQLYGGKVDRVGKDGPRVKPWQLANVRPGVCYVGLVYKVSELASDARHACCAAQMFLSDGEGIVFRGALGPWYHTDTRQFHLDGPSAKKLIEMVTAEYKLQHDAPPTELFIHATSAFTDEEWKGFQQACDSQTNLVAVQIVDLKNDLKMFRPGAYPIIRGSALKVSDTSAYFWTSGYVPRLDTYMGPETPNPILIRILRGMCSLDTVLIDILGLTKINFNTCLYNDRLPVTIRFANEVGDVLISAPLDGEPRQDANFEERDELLLGIDLAACGRRRPDTPCRAQHTVAIECQQIREEAGP